MLKIIIFEKEGFKMAIQFQPIRSIIYVDVVKEDYRHILKHWIYKHHIPYIISQFGTYLTKYTF